jgi:uncharacterized membrane protein YdbT with pleckstrin-like domain
MALVHPTWIIAALLSLAIAVAVSSRTLILRNLHLHSGQLLYQIYELLYLHKAVAIGVPGVVALMFFFATWSWWSLTYIELDDAALTYRLGAFSANSIPRRAVQDVRFTKGIGGMLFGYGTLRIFAGREIETIPFVPNVEKFASLLEAPPR